MREIKFRAWIEYPFSEDEDNPIYFMCYDLAFEEYEPINDLLKSVKHLMQYTGIKDKNGKEIYEGDIVRAYISSEWDEEVPRNEISLVEWDNDRFWCKSQLTNDWYSLSEFNWEVIGNIYENPELIKGEKIE